MLVGRSWYCEWDGSGIVVTVFGVGLRDAVVDCGEQGLKLEISRG